MEHIGNNIALIGMPGAGKSTIGRILARRLGFSYIDTDDLICQASGRSLHQIIESDGQDALREAEEAVISQLDVKSCVISTGGSAIYSLPGMNRLHQIARIVHLDCDLETVLARIGDASERGIIRSPGQSIGELYEERQRLYRQHADFTVDSSAGTPAEVALTIVDLLR